MFYFYNLDFDANNYNLIKIKTNDILAICKDKLKIKSVKGKHLTPKTFSSVSQRLYKLWMCNPENGPSIYDPIKHYKLKSLDFIDLLAAKRSLFQKLSTFKYNDLSTLKPQVIYQWILQCLILILHI